MPFPPLSWWMQARGAKAVMWDVHEHYEKMSRRSRYRIATAQGVAKLSVPLIGGRGQRAAMKDVLIDNRQPWARTHWRSIRTAYRRAPFFEHFEDSLDEFFARPYECLAHFNRASAAWMRTAFRLNFSDEESVAYERAPADLFDARDEKLRGMEPAMCFAPYTQVFGERHGFLENLSALDFLFAEGPGALSTL